MSDLIDDTDDNEEVTVTVEETEGDSGKEPEKQSGGDEEDDLAAQSEAVQKRIKKLTFKMREAERREQAALDYARGVQTQLTEIQKQRQSLGHTLVTEADTRIKAQEELAKKQLRTAYDTGDVDNQVEMQQHLARLEMERERVRQLKFQQEYEARQPVYQPPQPPVSRPDPQAEEWAERNDWFGRDDVMTNAAMSIHNTLVREGYSGSSQAYYKELDNRMRENFPHKFKTSDTARPTSAVGGARSVSSKRGVGRTLTENDLTPSQKKIARGLGIDYKSYAKAVNAQAERN
jgi:hypothetical protein